MITNAAIQKKKGTTFLSRSALPFGHVKIKDVFIPKILNLQLEKTF
jgi:hypothetical protein